MRVLALARSPWTARALLAAAAALAVWALVSRRAEAGAALARLDPAALTLAAVAGTGTVLCSGLVWRAVLADLGDRLPMRTAAAIFLIGQLGKYLPGSLWPVVMQTEIGRRHGVSRRRTAATSVVTLLVSLATALLLACATLPFAPQVPAGVRWFAVLVVPLLVLLHPAVLGRVLDLALRLARREPLEQWTTPRGTAVAAGWALLSWVCAGAQVFALAVPLGLAPDARSFALAAGGFALGWSIGFLVVFAPAGAGAREIALGAVLAGALPPGAVLVVVLVSRLLLTGADLLLAAVAAVAGRRIEVGRDGRAPRTGAP